jgi:hypothetical protein
MKMHAWATLAVCLPAFALAFSGLATGAEPVPSARRDWRPPAQFRYIPQPIHPTSLVNDGGFENGPPPGSAWTEGTTTVCEWITDPTSVFGIPAYEGTYVFWAGGYCPLGVANIDSVSQMVSLPAGTSLLSFWIYADRGDPDDDDLDVAYVAINGTYVWQRLISTANNTGVWVNQNVDVSSYAGQTVELRLGGRGVGLTGNVLFDAIETLLGPTKTRTSTWGAIKTIYR